MLGRFWQARRDAAALRRRAIPDDLWKRTQVRFPFLRRHDAATEAELRRLTSLFLDRKEFHCTGGLRLTDMMAVAIAAQACLPVLRLGLQRYDGFVGIVVHPDAVRAQRVQADGQGIVHEYDEDLAGEAMEGGPVMLAWRDVRLGARAGTDSAQPERAYNVVIHEFAHVLDMAQGPADGMPELPPDLPAREWQRVFSQAFGQFVQRVEAAQAGQDDTDGLPGALDPYAASAPEEFFAVCSEVFFVDPWALQREHPEVYALLSRLYRQDPATEMPRPRRA